MERTPAFIADQICLEIVVYGYRDSPEEAVLQLRRTIEQQAHDLWGTVPLLEVRTDGG